MPARRLSEESGYSLVEVMASIMILAIAILPMVGMFDAGLNSAARSSNYDKARALANLKLEEAKNLPFPNVRDNFPDAAGAPGTPHAYDGSGRYQSGWLTQPGFANFEYRIGKQYMAQPPTDSDADPADPSETFATSPSATSLIRVTVTVQWGADNTFTAFGLVSQ